MHFVPLLVCSGTVLLSCWCSVVFRSYGGRPLSKDGDVRNKDSFAPKAPDVI